MTSKEFIQNEIDNLKSILAVAKDDNLKTIIKESEEDIEQYNQVLKDLEEKEKQDKMFRLVYWQPLNRYYLAIRLNDEYLTEYQLTLRKEEYENLSKYIKVEGD